MLWSICGVGRMSSYFRAPESFDGRQNLIIVIYSAMVVLGQTLKTKAKRVEKVVLILAHLSTLYNERMNTKILFT